MCVCVCVCVCVYVCVLCISIIRKPFPIHVLIDLKFPRNFKISQYIELLLPNF